MKLVCYTTGGEPPEIRPASAERAWMDATPQQYARRCLPLSIANAWGWQLVNPKRFTARWKGGEGVDQVEIATEFGSHPTACSHFGSGVLTFRVNGIFRTVPGYNLLVAGPINEFRDYCHPMAGVVETDWASCSFTMNWKFTQSDKWVEFNRGDTIATLCPVKRGMLEKVQPMFVPIDADPVTKDEYEKWADRRAKFNSDLAKREPEAVKRGWERNYFQGRDVGGGDAPEHTTRLKLKPFVKWNAEA